MKILSSFTHPQVVPNLYEFLSFVEHKRMLVTMTDGRQLLTQEINGYAQSKFMLTNAVK